MQELSPHEERILVLAPTGRDMELTCAFLDRSGIAGVPCRDMDELATKTQEGCGGIILAEEVLGPESAQSLVSHLRKQPSWSEIPLCVVTSGGENSVDTLRKLVASCGAGNVTVLERPFRSATLHNAIEVVLSARRRQYQVRDLIEERKVLLTNLEETVQKRTAALQELTVRLRNLAVELVSAEQRERKRLASLLHDDLQQLLAAASMHLHNALGRTNGHADRGAVEEAKKWIGEATLAARDLTRQLRPPALYEAGLVAALHGLASEMNERHGFKVIIDGEEPSTPVDEDVKALLFESIRELLFNATKHAGTREATVSVRERVKFLHVAVEDQGEGFDVEAVAKNETKGGFGLFSIRERLTALGGSLSIVSAPGQGTHTALEVPLLHQPPEQQQALTGEKPFSQRKQEETASPGKRIRVLLVDDHAMVRQGLATILDEDEQIEVVMEAADGLAAVNAVEHHHPDVVLMDVNMPRMNGIEATREIHRRWPQMIVIGLSVQDDDATSQAMRKAGATHFLSKAGDSVRMISAILDATRSAGADRQ